MWARICVLLLCCLAATATECEKECGECQECKLNSNGEKKCVQQADCCKEGQGSIQCLMSPCHDSMQKCPGAITCIAEYCEPGCTPHYYDGLMNELTEEQCSPQDTPMNPTLEKCSHKPDEGDGDEKSEKFYYNRVYGECSTFEYSGQGGNENRFDTEEECQEFCKEIPQCPIPDLGMVPPGCKLTMETQSPDGCFYPQLECDRCASTNPCPSCHTCETDQDGDSFCCIKQENCVENPISPPEPEIPPPSEDTIRKCRMDADPGDPEWCKPEYDYFYYDRNLASCQGFKWGCRGNHNAFTTKEECETTCSGVPPCPIPSLIPPPLGCRYTFPAGLSGCTSPLLICPDTEGCQADTCGKCSKCSNEFSSQLGGCVGDECKPTGHNCEPDEWCKQYECKEAHCSEGHTCVFTKEGAKCEIDVDAMEVIRTCRLNSDTGPCKAAKPMTYYDKFYASCENFTYGGCQGNDNRFTNARECMEKCGHVGPCPVPGLMMAPPGCEVGSDITISGCPHQKLVCKGTGCDKEPCQECEKCRDEWPTDCEPQYGPVSLLPPGETPKPLCLPRGRTCTRDPVCERFKCDDKKCEPGTKCVWKDGAASCEKATFSPGTLLTCRLPKVIGPCRALMPSWHYNSVTSQCESFGYGGCDGNANRFESKRACEQLCDGVPACEPMAIPMIEEGCLLKSFINEDGCPGFAVTCPPKPPPMPLPAEPEEAA